MRRVTSTPFPDLHLLDEVGFGAAVRAVRTSTGMTIADAAMMLGIARQTLQDLETGVGSVGIGLAMKIAKEIGVSFFVVPASQKAIVEKKLREIVDPIREDDENHVEGAELLRHVERQT